MTQLTEMTQLLLLPVVVVVVVGLQLVLQVQLLLLLLLLLLLARGCEARVAGSRRVQDPSNWATAAAGTGQLRVHMPALLLVLLQNCKLVVLLLLLLCWPLGAPVSLPSLLLLVAAAEPLVLVVDVLCWTLLPACCCRRELSCSHTCCHPCAQPCYVTHACTHSPLLLLLVLVVVVPQLLVLLVLLVQAGVTEDLSYSRAVSCRTRSTHCRGRRNYSYPYPCPTPCQGTLGPLQRRTPQQLTAAGPLQWQKGPIKTQQV
jgi:hypothetical protein